MALYCLLLVYFSFFLFLTFKYILDSHSFFLYLFLFQPRVCFAFSCCLPSHFLPVFSFSSFYTAICSIHIFNLLSFRSILQFLFLQYNNKNVLLFLCFLFFFFSCLLQVKHNCWTEKYPTDSYLWIKKKNKKANIHCFNFVRFG